MDEFYKAFREALEHGHPFAIATVVRVHASTPREPGAKMGIRPDGSIFGTIGGGELEELVKADALEVIRTRKSVLKIYSLIPSAAGGIGTECGGEAEIFIEPVGFGSKLLIFGAGHIAGALYKIASVLGMGIEIVDERPEYARAERFPGAIVRCAEISALDAEGLVTPDTYAVVVTHGHGNDREALKFLLGHGAAYVGMIGSRRKVKVLFDLLAKEGADRVELASVHAPIGLNIGAESPQEIALSILAEIVAIQRLGKSPASMKDT
ncbi:MAG: XdhC/CoxI family protein [bacterium]|nr:XdhC/CoxI family protein [bacterium]